MLVVGRKHDDGKNKEQASCEVVEGVSGGREREEIDPLECADKKKINSSA